MATQIQHRVADPRLALVRKSVSLGRSVTLPYVERGDPAGPSMLLLHGYTDSWRSFMGVLRHLPPEVRAIAMTQRGHGDASRPAEGYHPRTLAADAAAFVDAIGLESAVVVGHSMGSLVAQRLAIACPGRVRGLALIGAFMTLGGNPVVRDLWDGAIEAMADPIDPGFVRAFQEGTLARPVAPAFLEMVVAESLKVPARVWRAALAGQIDDDVSGELDRVRAPALIVWGDRDAIVPLRHQEKLAASIVGGRLVVYPGSGHGVHWECPARVAADLAGFARQCPG